MVVARRRDHPMGERVAWDALSYPADRSCATKLGHEETLGLIKFQVLAPEQLRRHLEPFPDLPPLEGAPPAEAQSEQRAVIDEVIYELMGLSDQEYVDIYAATVKERSSAESANAADRIPETAAG